MKLSIDDEFDLPTKEQWLLVILVGLFVYRVLTSNIMYDWLGMIWTCLGLVICGFLFLQLFNLSDGKDIKINVGKIVKILIGIAFIVVAIFLLLIPFNVSFITVFYPLWNSLNRNQQYGIWFFMLMITGIIMLAFFVKGSKMIYNETKDVVATLAYSDIQGRPTKDTIDDYELGTESESNESDNDQRF